MVKLLCSGDLHIGRLPGALADEVDASSASPTAVWRRMVDHAIDHEVDVVLLSGDLIDRSNRYYEAFGPLEHGIGTLIRHGIPVVAVAGNHDYDVLPRFATTFRSLADQAPSDPSKIQLNDGSGARFHFLGADGRWERLTLYRDGRPLMHIDGWSFPTEHVRENPLRTLKQREVTKPRSSHRHGESDAVPTVGIIHADLNQTHSRYAPVNLDELRRSGHHFWLLGHIHKPSYDDPDGICPVLYPGTPQPLHTGETGMRGPWIVEMRSRGIDSSSFDIKATQTPIAAVAYESLKIDVSGAETMDHVVHRLITEMKKHLDETVVAWGSQLRHMLYRIELAGRTVTHQQIGAHIPQLTEDFRPHTGDVTAHIVDLDVQTSPDRNLQRIAEGRGAPAMLARLLLHVEAGVYEDAGVNALIKRAREKVAEIQRDRAYTEISMGDVSSSSVHVTDDDIAGWIRDQGINLLDALLAQREDPS